MKQKELTYQTKKCVDLSDKELKMCSDLFSNHYGVYSGNDGIHKKGQRIRLGIKYYMNIRNTQIMLELQQKLKGASLIKLTPIKMGVILSSAGFPKYFSDHKRVYRVVRL